MTIHVMGWHSNDRNTLLITYNACCISESTNQNFSFPSIPFLLLYRKEEWFRLIDSLMNYALYFIQESVLHKGEITRSGIGLQKIECIIEATNQCYSAFFHHASFVCYVYMIYQRCIQHEYNLKTTNFMY